MSNNNNNLKSQNKENIYNNNIAVITRTIILVMAKALVIKALVMIMTISMIVDTKKEAEKSENRLKAKYFPSKTTVEKPDLRSKIPVGAINKIDANNRIDH